MAVRRALAPLQVAQAARQDKLQLDELAQNLCELSCEQQVVCQQLCSFSASLTLCFLVPSASFAVCLAPLPAALLQHARLIHTDFVIISSLLKINSTSEILKGICN